jgi:hypothetical protein
MRPLLEFPFHRRSKSGYGPHVASVGVDGPHSRKPGSARIYRGSKKRVARIRMRDNMSVGMWCFVVFMVLLILVGVPWMVTHHADFHRPPPNTNGISESAKDSK